MNHRSGSERPGISRRRFVLKSLWGALALGTISLGAACQQAGTPAPTAAPAQKAPATTGSNDPYPADVVERAKKEGKAVLYTSLDTKIVESIIGAFKDRFGVNVEFFRAGSADVSSKVLQEAEAGRLAADVIDISDVAAFLVMKERGILEAYESPFRKTIDKKLMDADGTWTACRLTQAVFQWNTSQVKEPAQTWNDLDETAWQGKLAFFNDAGGSGVPRLYGVATSLGWDVLEKIGKNRPLRTDTPQTLTQLLEQGERAFAFAQNDNIAWRSRSEGRPTDFLFPKDGVPTEPGAVGKAKNSPQPNAGLLLLNWWLGDEGQKLLVQGGKYSSRSDLEPPTDMPPLSQIKLLTTDYEDYQMKREEVQSRMASIFGG
jgi:iron(III) transport system substrate-binding protein